MTRDKEDEPCLRETSRMMYRSIVDRFIFVACFFVVNSENGHEYSLRFPLDLSLDYLQIQYTEQKYGLVMISNGSAPYPVYDTCIAYLEEFGIHASRFIRCTIEKARPFRFCEECVVHYKHAMQSYADIEEDDEDKNGCKSLLLNADRIQVLNEIYNNIKQIWEEANCKECFSSVSIDVNGTVVFQYSKDTTEFMDKYKTVSSCFRHYSFPRDGNDSVCLVCRGNYTQLNSFYKEVRAAKKDLVCMDLVDMMNYTRLMWGQQLHCTKHSADDAIVVIIGIIFLTMPILFYVGARYFVARTKRKLMLQKRMSQIAARTLFVSLADSTKEEEETQLLSSSS
ncbi:osteopetrosis-associated transmembrane protein 1-like [Pecten maximus]|uniref:osteopetrosis-associated transmembrane protein 1-like n=1 Tax=Pecten maximus TaxID=6579 RepID=UPI001458611C|nr:osteopetrosis-associated transmembrane protein 1-like [Pecten maximus]